MSEVTAGRRHDIDQLGLVDEEAVGPAAPGRRWLVLAVIAAALLLRLAVVVLVRDGYVPVNDAMDYDRIASSLVAGDGYGDTSIPGAVGPSAFRAPLYPAALGSVYLVTGEHSWTWGLVQNAIIGTALVGLIGLVAWQLFGRRIGMIALVMAAVHPTLVLFGTSLQIEPLLASLELAAIAVALEHRRRPRGLWWPLAAGALVGLTILTREIGLWLLPSVLLLVWTIRPRWSIRALAAPGLVLMIAVLVVAPWTARNALRFDALVPVTTTTGVGLAGVYNDTSRANSTYPGLWSGPWFDPAMGEIIRADLTRDEVELDRALREAAIDYARDHPGYVARVAFWNTVRLFDLNGPGHSMFIRKFLPYPSFLTRVSVYASYLVYALAALGATRALARRAPKVLWLFPALVWLNLAVLSGNIRYRASIEPFLLLLAAVAVGSWAGWHAREPAHEAATLDQASPP